MTPSQNMKNKSLWCAVMWWELCNGEALTRWRTICRVALFFPCFFDFLYQLCFLAGSIKNNTHFIQTLSQQSHCHVFPALLYFIFFSWQLLCLFFFLSSSCSSGTLMTPHISMDNGHCNLSVTVPSTCNIHLTQHHSKCGEAGCVNTHSAGDILWKCNILTQRVIFLQCFWSAAFNSNGITWL